MSHRQAKKQRHPVNEERSFKLLEWWKEVQAKNREFDKWFWETQRMLTEKIMADFKEASTCEGYYDPD